jgi:hypothetical protein
MRELEREFQSRGVVRGGLTLLRPRDALALVSKAREASLGVLGVDGFFISANATQPSLEDSIDLSNASASQSSWDAAEEFLKRYLHTDMYFEVVLD